MRLLLIPEDFRKDEYMIQPLFLALLKKIGKNNSKVIVCKDPLLGGVEQALKKEKIGEIIERYRGMIDIFILCIDRDGNKNRDRRLASIEKEIAIEHFLTIAAIEEIETWILAGLELPAKWQWKDVRSETHPKEVYFNVLAKEMNVLDTPGGGRKPLGIDASKKIDAICLKCPELAQVLAKIQSLL